MALLLGEVHLLFVGALIKLYLVMIGVANEKDCYVFNPRKGSTENAIRTNVWLPTDVTADEPVAIRPIRERRAPVWARDYVMPAVCRTACDCKRRDGISTDPQGLIT